MDRKKFSLVLSGGAALGLAHLGIFKYLEERKEVPSEIIGTSMGAVLGAAYALGFGYDDLMEILERTKIYSLFGISGRRPAFFRRMKLYEYLRDEFYGEATMKEAKIPLKIVATNARDGEKRVFYDEEVRIIDAVFASITIPTLFEPYKVAGEYFFDGYLVSNLPVELAGTKEVVAVDVHNESNLKVRFPERKRRIFKRVRQIAKIANQSLKIMVVSQTREKKQFYRARYIEPDLGEFTMLEFSEYETMAEIGYKEAKKVLENG